MAGGLDALEPFRHDVGVGAEEQRDDGKLRGVDALQPVPQHAALVAVELDLDGLQKLIHLGIGIARIVLARIVVGGGGDFLGMEGRARHVFRRAQPGEHGEAGEFALGHGLAEIDPGRFVADARSDADVAPLALQYLLHQLAAAVARRRHQLDGEALAGAVVAHALALDGPARGIEKGAGFLEIAAVNRRVRGVDPVQRVDESGGDGLAAVEQLLVDGFAVQRVDQRPAHAPVLEHRVVEVDVEMLVDQAGLEADVEFLAVALLEGDGLIEGEAELAGDVIDGAREEIGLERRGVADDLDDDAAEIGLLAPPGRIALQHHIGSRDLLGDAVGAEVKARIGGVGVEYGAVLVLGRFGELRPVEMGGDQAEAVDVVVIEGDPVEVQGKGLGVLDVDLEDAPVKLAGGDAAPGMASDLVGEQHVGGADRRLIAPNRARADGVGDGDTLLAVRQILGHGEPVLDRRQLGAEHADQLPVLVVDRERPARHGQHVGLGQHRIDVGMEGRRELGHADDELVLARGPGRRGQGEGEGGEKAKGKGSQHVQSPGRRGVHDGRLGL